MLRLGLGFRLGHLGVKVRARIQVRYLGIQVRVRVRGSCLG